MSKRRYHQFEGFTMIELVMVIVIIGILAAAALPRFANLTGQAQIAANQGVAGALRSAVGIAHAAWIAAGATTSASSNITLDGTTVSVNTNGWPDNAAAYTASGANCLAIFNAVLANAPTATATAGSCSDTPCYLATGASGVCTFYLYGGGSVVSSRTITYNMSSGAVGAT